MYMYIYIYEHIYGGNLIRRMRSIEAERDQLCTFQPTLLKASGPDYLRRDNAGTAPPLPPKTCIYTYIYHIYMYIYIYIYIYVYIYI